MYVGECLEVHALDEGFVEVRFDRRDSSVNMFDWSLLKDFRSATELIAGSADIRGVLLTSGKDVFITGGVIGDLGSISGLAHTDVVTAGLRANRILMAFENLQVPTVAVINGPASGGGLEIGLAAAFRVMSTAAAIGFPEINAGLPPGFGGTVRLPRVAGPLGAIEWISDGQMRFAGDALASGVVDEVGEPACLRDVAMSVLRRAASGEVDWWERQARKLRPLSLPVPELSNIFFKARTRIADDDSTRRDSDPALFWLRAALALAGDAIIPETMDQRGVALAAIELMEQTTRMRRFDAQRLECDMFARLAKVRTLEEEKELR